jgi:hypothetical protein
MNFFKLINLPNDDIKLWTDNEDIELKNELNNYKNLEDICFKHNRTNEDIKRRIIKVSIDIIKDDNDKIDIYLNYINSLNNLNSINNLNKRWTENEEKILLNSINNNIDINVIIKNHNRPNTDIQNRITKLLNILKEKNEKKMIYIASLLNININNLYEKIKNYNKNSNNILNFVLI